MGPQDGRPKKIHSLSLRFVYAGMEGLNREQYRASRAGGGVSLVVAGAGTGKTKTLVEKVRSVIDDPSMAGAGLLVLTFSRKAAEELRERIGGGTERGGERITAGTFHSFCLGLLRENAGILARLRGVSGFPSVADDEMIRSIILDLAGADLSRFKGLPAGMVCDFLGRIDSLEAREKGALREAGILAELARLGDEFREVKRDKNMIDYGDMMNLAIALLEEYPGVRAAINARYRYIFVDEFQDVAPDNVRLLRLLLHERDTNLFVVGDDWQSIYGFRGSCVDYIVRMRRYFPGVTVFRLAVNYRSRREIVVLTSRFIRKNRFRTRKRLRSDRGRGGRVRFHAARTLDDEAEIVDEIISGTAPERRLAVLYRNNWQGRHLDSRCRQIGPGPAVQFMTMHASKGLEFDVVVVAGISDSIIPDPDNDIEEERRLLYVACTRAREELHVIVRLNERGEVPRFGRELGLSRSPGVPRSRRPIPASSPPIG